VGKGAFGESPLSETPIVWRNTSVTFARHDDDIRVLVTGIKVVLECLMVDFVVPVLADNPLA